MQLTLQTKLKKLTKGHVDEALVVDDKGAPSDPYELLPVSGPHCRVAQVLNQGKTCLENRKILY